MAAPHDPSNSKVGEDRMEEWRKLEITGVLADDAIPGVGQATIDKMMENPATDSTYKLFAAYLGKMTPGQTVLGAAQEFKNDLGELGTPAQFQDTVVTAIVEKLMAGFRVPMKMDEARLSSSRMSHADMEAFLTKDLTGNLAEDFKGISDASCKKLADEGGVESTWMFFAMALGSADANDFETTIKECGVAGGWSATVVHQVVEKLASGIPLAPLALAPDRR
jgi:hypothetical protein